MDVKSLGSTWGVELSYEKNEVQVNLTVPIGLPISEWHCVMNKERAKELSNKLVACLADIEKRKFYTVI